MHYFNVEVIKDFTDGRQDFKKGEVYTTYGDSVIVKALWICDVPSPFFEQHFKIVNAHSE